MYRMSDTQKPAKTQPVAFDRKQYSRDYYEKNKELLKKKRLA